MKLRISKNELNECIAEALYRVLNEGFDDEEYDDIDAMLAANDPNFAAAQRAAKEDSGTIKKAKEKKAAKPAGIKTGHRGRPTKAEIEAWEAHLKAEQEAAANAAEEEGSEEVENSEEIEPDEDLTPDEIEAKGENFDMGVANMTTEELKNMSNDASLPPRRRATANGELERRKKMLAWYKEDGMVDWGYTYDETTGTIEPTHTSLGGDGSYTYDGRGADLGGTMFHHHADNANGY